MSLPPAAYGRGSCLDLLVDLALVLPIRVVLRLALLDVGGAPGARLALLLLVVLRLGLEDERLTRARAAV